MESGRQSAIAAHVVEGGSDVEADVRLKYFEARQSEDTYEAMGAARWIAEAVCEALAKEVPTQMASAYAREKTLNARIGILEQVAPDPVPWAVIAGLRTLQAYGNLASHYKKGVGRQPPPPATTSAMASLGLVVRWFLSRNGSSDLAEDERTRGLPMREPPPGSPSLVERWRIHKRAKISRPEIKLEGEVSVDAALGVLYTYYSQAVSICERICREVLARELTIEAATIVGDELPMLLEQVAEARPARVPRTVAADVRELWRRRMTVLKAMKDRTDDVEHLIVEVQHRDLMTDIVRWFERDYLSRTNLERFWFKYVVFVALGAVFVSPCKSGWEEAAQNDLRHDLAQKYCSNPKPELSAICVELSKKSSGAER